MILDTVTDSLRLRAEARHIFLMEVTRSSWR